VICGLHRLRAVGAHLFVTAVVEEDYVAAADLAGYFLFDHGAWRSVPVVASDVPHDWSEAQLAGDAEDAGAASSEGGAEEIGMFANCVFESRAAGGEFLANFSRAFESQQGMGEGVVADDVAGLDDLAGELGALVDVASDQEKSCVDIVLREDFQQAQGVWVVGAIIVSQCELPGSARQAGEGAAEPLSGGRHGLVAGGGQGGGGCRGEHGSEHGGIVKDWVIGEFGN